MIFIIFFTIVTFCTIIAILRSGKSFKHICREIKFELIYQLLGGRSLIEDIILKKKNKTELPNKSGQYALVTGGSRGLGVEIVKMLLQCDMHVIVGCRNVQAGEKVENIIRENGIKTGTLKVFKLDISSIDSVKCFCSKIKQSYTSINILINNAGIMFPPYEESVDGYESQFAVNYLGHYLLTHLLFPLILKAGNDSETKSRIVNVTSIAHFAGDIKFDDINMKSQFISSEAYAQSKLAQVLFTLQLQKVLDTTKQPVQIHCVHPGICNTDLFNGTPLKKVFPWMPNLLFKSAAAGATSIVHAAVSGRLEARGGTYISNCRVVPVSARATCVELQEELFTFTNQALQIAQFGQQTDITCM